MLRSTLRRFLVGLGVLAVLTGLAIGCGSDDSNGGTAAGVTGGYRIAFLLPETQTPHYKSEEGRDFEKKVDEVCKNCEVLRYSAAGEASKQQSQAEVALAQGAEVLVVDPVDPKAAAAIVAKANARSVPVLSYDRLIENAKPDYYISFDAIGAGELQAATLSKKLEENGSTNGPIVIVNRDQKDREASAVKKGVLKGFIASDVTIIKAYNTPNGSTAKAESEMRQAIDALGDNGFEGVNAADDEIAAAAIAAMESTDIDPAEKPTVGLGATLAGVRRILAGRQYATIYKPIGRMAAIGAEVAVDLASGNEIPQAKTSEEVSRRGKADVLSILVEPIAVTKDNVKQTVIAEEFIAATSLCAGPYAKDCKEAGIL